GPSGSGTEAGRAAAGKMGSDTVSPGCRPVRAGRARKKVSDPAAHPWLPRPGALSRSAGISYNDGSAPRRWGLHGDARRGADGGSDRLMRATLLLEDGRVFHGRGHGFEGEAVG